MPEARLTINPSRALFIKLGEGGNWASECIEDSTLRLSFREIPSQLAQNATILSDWSEVSQKWLELDKTKSKASDNTRQIKEFYTQGKETLWITFHGRRLWWCFAQPEVTLHASGDGTTIRKCIDRWRSTDTKGKSLTFDTLSGSILATEGYRGTICEIKSKSFEYLRYKLNGILLPEVDAAKQVQDQMLEKLVPLMQLLTPEDFELLVDLIFSVSGWRRVSGVGETQKFIDLDLLLPTTKQRACVQVKSSTNRKELDKYIEDLQQYQDYDLMFFVWHTSKDLSESAENSPKIKLIGPESLAQWVLDAGLSSWLLNKVS